MKNFLVVILSAFALNIAQVSASEPTRDYSHVTSREIAEALVAKGELFTVLLFPKEFGGEEIQENIAYVPPGIPELKAQNTDTLIRFFKDGLIDNLTVTPEYKGDSLVPSRIVIKATHSSKSGSFEPTIEVW